MPQTCAPCLPIYASMKTATQIFLCPEDLINALIKCRAKVCTYLFTVQTHGHNSNSQLKLRLPIDIPLFFKSGSATYNTCILSRSNNQVCWLLVFSRRSEVLHISIFYFEVTYIAEGVWWAVSITLDGWFNINWWLRSRKTHFLASDYFPVRFLVSSTYTDVFFASQLHLQVWIWKSFGFSTCCQCWPD